MQKPNIETEVYNNNKKCDWSKKKKKLKSLDFIVPIKSATTTNGVKKGKNTKESPEEVKT